MRKSILYNELCDKRGGGGGGSDGGW